MCAEYMYLRIFQKWKSEWQHILFFVSEKLTKLEEEERDSEWILFV